MYEYQASEAYHRESTPRTQPSIRKPSNELTSEPSTAVSWPIILAIIPTLGAFVAGSAEVWSDFIMILLILFYVYKWITVPWSYYESARSKRIIYQCKNFNDNSNKRTSRRKEFVEEELRRHELLGLIWVIASPSIAGYTLQYSRYCLSNYDKYMSTFNVTVFILAATIKPLIHVMALLRERTLFLQSEMQIDETQVEILQRKLELMQEELDNLRKAFATKRDLGQMAQGIKPSIQQLSKAIKRFEKRESTFRSLSENRFTDLDHKVKSFDQFICYSIEQDQHRSAQTLVVALVLLPINLTFWAAKRLTVLLPIPRAMINFIDTTSKKSQGLPSRPSKHLTHTDLTGVASQLPTTKYNEGLRTSMRGYSEEESGCLSDR